MMNPFNQTGNERLYNIATGKAAYLDIEEVLLTVNVSKCIKRLSKWIKRLQRFHERIIKQKMETFKRIKQFMPIIVTVVTNIVPKMEWQ